jgi:uncharacterized membrane protein
VITLPEEPLIKKIKAAFCDPEYPFDLILVEIWLSASLITIYLPILNTTWVRYLFTIPLVLFIPGYCLIAALFPKKDDIDIMERVALSFGLSFAIIPFIGLGLNFTPWGIQLHSLVLVVSLFTLVLILVTFYRRAILPSDEQFKITFSVIVDTIREGLLPTKSSRTLWFLNIVLILVILIAFVTAVFVIAFPKEGEHFTEFYILGENQTAADYPSLIKTGQNYQVYLGVVNHEYRNTTYTVETWIMSTEFNTMTNTSSIIVMDPNDHISFPLSYNETIIIPYNLSIKKQGYNRMDFLLFNETVPGTEIIGNDRINASYRNLHLWITVL